MRKLRRRILQCGRRVIMYGLRSRQVLTDQPRSVRECVHRVRSWALLPNRRRRLLCHLHAVSCGQPLEHRRARGGVRMSPLCSGKVLGTCRPNSRDGVPTLWGGEILRRGRRQRRCRLSAVSRGHVFAHGGSCRGERVRCVPAVSCGHFQRQLGGEHLRTLPSGHVQWRSGRHEPRFLP